MMNKSTSIQLISYLTLAMIIVTSLIVDQDPTSQILLLDLDRVFHKVESRKLANDVCEDRYVLFGVNIFFHFYNV